jgi:hypothetical protein
MELRGNPTGLGGVRRLANGFRIEIDAANASSAAARDDQRESPRSNAGRKAG